MVLTLPTIVGPMMQISVTLKMTNVLEARHTGEKCSSLFYATLSHYKNLLDIVVAVTPRRVPLELVIQSTFVYSFTITACVLRSCRPLNQDKSRRFTKTPSVSLRWKIYFSEIAQFILLF